ncbi:unnamed protein product [Arctia plantaginis]|uniref:mannose-6-phosphate isomerase n=1 Tax=Arctia plantaginis TaxID=874455 RepID=A0A8S0ZQK2_ARCPL|nr:unnamed protein product [Arctia plantaginis]
MHRNAAVISVTCILLCLTFNYTFPLHRGNWNLNSYNNLSMKCGPNVDRSKKMAINFENAMKRIKESTQDFSKNFRAHFTDRNDFTEEDFRHFEQLVIMKKNPYIDLKEIELKFSPTDKNIRQSVRFESGSLPQNFLGEPGIWEPMEEGPNVEITNRGLTGFAIPAKIASPKVMTPKVNIIDDISKRLSMELQCKVQNYDWGKLGEDSVVAKLLASAQPEIEINPTQPYAELWMGTHPNGPSLIKERDVLLSEYIKDNLDALGPAVRKQFGAAVPFLLKVLSIRKALSIQAHPNKAHAEELHKQFPDIYKDPNHKPELAIALTPFEALCGFRPLSQIQGFLKKLPELVNMLSKESVDILQCCEEQGDNGTILKSVFQSLMTSDKTIVASTLLAILDRLDKEDEAIQVSLLYPLVKRLHMDFPGDIGCFAPYFMNYMLLQPGQAIFLKPNLPHAYLSGDCVECMACSDNVVRAGLTPKHIDVPTLVDMLDYCSYTLDQLLFNPHLEDPNTAIWKPPVPDFAVVRIEVEGGDSFNTIMRDSPSLLIVISGYGVACDTEPIEVRPGSVIFLKASRQLNLTPARISHLEIYQAICNV